MTFGETRTVLITGGASGIGKFVSENLINCGVNVGIIDICDDILDVAKNQSEGSGKFCAAIADISKVDDVAAAVTKIENALGPVNGLVNNAGIVNNIAPIEKMSQQAWEREIAVNLTGPFNMIRAVIGGMRRRKYGRIVNVSSGAARGGLINQVGYSSSKAGILGLTKSVALEYARFGISCNSVLPGMIATEKVESMPPIIKSAAMTMTPAGRFGDMDEASHLISFLLSAKAGFINGSDIDITGGAHLNVIPLGSQKEAVRQIS